MSERWDAAAKRRSTADMEGIRREITAYLASGSDTLKTEFEEAAIAVEAFHVGPKDEAAWVRLEDALARLQAATEA